MWRRLYAVLMIILMPLILGYFCWRGRKDTGYREHLRERLGYIGFAKEWQGGLVIHSVSVGETLAARALVEQVLTNFPQLPITVTCMTPTARRLIVDRFAERVRCLYFPIDTQGCCRRFIRRSRPQAVWIMETELWPNFMRELRLRGIPSALLNARLSAKSAAGYQRFQAILSSSWQSLSWVSAQDDASAQRMLGLGVSADRLAVDGNLKFDIDVPANAASEALNIIKGAEKRPIILAASTHPGEHEHIIDGFKKLLSQRADALLIIAPRHPEQFNAVGELLQASGLSMQRRSTGGQVVASTQVLLADSMGEMLLWASVAQVSYVGGSLIERGGHNPLEMIAAGSVVLSGPSVYNFAQVYSQLEQAGGVTWVQDSNTFANETARLLSSNTQLEHQRQSGLTVLNKHKGATERMLEHGAEATLTGLYMVSTQANKTEFIKFDKAVLPECEAKHFSPKYWQQQKAIAGNSTGRATVWFIQQGDHGMLLRHYYRGGLVGRVNKDRFMSEPAERSRAISEFDLLMKLQELQLPVPKPIAARMAKARWFGYRADILVEVIPGAVDVFRLLREKPLSEQNWQDLGAAVKKLHDHNVYHSDLNCHNLMLDDNDKAWIVDFDKCGFKEPGDWKQENLARLKRSLLKEKGKYDTFYWKERRDWPEFLTGYEKS